MRRPECDASSSACLIQHEGQHRRVDDARGTAGGEAEIGDEAVAADEAGGIAHEEHEWVRLLLRLRSGMVHSGAELRLEVEPTLAALHERCHRRPGSDAVDP